METYKASYDMDQTYGSTDSNAFSSCFQSHTISSCSVTNKIEQSKYETLTYKVYHQTIIESINIHRQLKKKKLHLSQDVDLYIYVNSFIINHDKKAPNFILKYRQTPRSFRNRESKRNRTYDMCLKHDHIVYVDINQLCVMVSGKRQTNDDHVRYRQKSRLRKKKHKLIIMIIYVV